MKTPVLVLVFALGAGVLAQVSKPQIFTKTAQTTKNIQTAKMFELIQQNGPIPPMTLRAATATNNGKTEVRLRWLINEGWIPEGKGFNVYKVVNGAKTGPLNSAPITVNESKIPAPKRKPLSFGAAPSGYGVAGKFALRVPTNPLVDALHTAKTNLQGVDRKVAFSFSPHNVKPMESAAPTFSALRSKIAQVSGKSLPGVPVSRILQTALESPEVRPYSNKLGVTLESRTNRLQQHDPQAATMVPRNRNGVAAANTNPRVNSPFLATQISKSATIAKAPPVIAPLQMHTLMQTISPVDSVRNARAQLAVGSLTMPAMADALGLSFTDTQAQNGQQVQYVLDFVPSSGAPVDVATDTLTVGSDPQPLTPDGLDGTQIGVNKVWLYWKPAPSDVVAKLVLPSYHVFRVDAANPSGFELSEASVLKAVQPSLSDPNTMVEPLFSFEDGSAPVGAVTYKVYMQDAFGRMSASPATISLTVQDWETPQPAGAVKTKLNDAKAPQVLWEASSSPGAKYRIYRIDVARMAKEGDAYKPDLASPDGVDGQAVLADNGHKLEGLLAQRGPIVTQAKGVSILKQKGSFATAVGLKPYLSWVDASAAKDKYYKYLVTAVYAKNGRDSEGHVSGLIGVPLMTPPPSPQGLTGSFELLPKRFNRVIRHTGQLYNFAPLGGVEQVNKPIGFPGPGPVERIKLYQPANPQLKQPVGDQILRNSAVVKAGPLLKGLLPPKVEYAGQAVLNWQGYGGPGAPIHYKIYRFPVKQPEIRSFLKLSSTVFKLSPSLKTLDLGGGAASMALPAKPSGGGAGGGIQLAKPLQAAKAESIFAPSLTHISSLKARDFALKALVEPTVATETNGTIVKDGYTASPVGQDVDYLVVPVNQWGVEGDGAKVRVHIRPTIAPSVPTLIEAGVNPDRPDQARLMVVPNPASEEVGKYVVLRKQLPNPEPKTHSSKFTSRIADVNRPGLITTVGKGGLLAKPTALVKAPVTAAKPAFQEAALGASATVRLASMSALYEAISTFRPVDNSSLDVVTDGGFVQIIDKSTEANKYYAYRVIAVNSSAMQSGESGFMEAATRLGSLPAPTLGTPTFDKTGVSIPITGRIVGSLILERSQSVGGTDTDFIQIGYPMSSTPIRDNTVVFGQTYKYRVRMVMDAIASPPSAVVTVAYKP